MAGSTTYRAIRCLSLLALVGAALPLPGWAQQPAPSTDRMVAVDPIRCWWRTSAGAVRIGETIRGRMSAWQDRHPQIGDVRGLGAMLAIELVRDPATKEPAPELAARVTEEAARRGLLLLRAGVHSNCIRVLCPLVITDPELDEALDAWDEALESVLA